MIIFGVDPGKVTGLALWCDDCVRPETSEVQASSVGTMIRRMLDDHHWPPRSTPQGPTCFAIERFVQGSRKTRQPHALEVLGQVDAIANELGAQLVHQNPGPAVRIASNQRLRDLGWYVASRDQHANAAQRHVLLALASLFPETFASIVGI